MKFEPIKYLEWFKTKKDVKFDLCRSSVASCLFQELDLNISQIELTGKNEYGYIPLLEAIGERFDVPAEQVVSTVGTSHALFVACAALLEKGDRVLVEDPAYEPLVAVPRSFEAEIVRFKRTFSSGYGIDLENIKNLMSPDVKLVILTNLHNPSGAFLSHDDLNAVAELAAANGAWVLIDEIYLEFLSGEKRTTSFHLGDNILALSSLTKVFGLGGLRCGWILAPERLVRKFRHVIDFMNVEGAYIADLISFEAFKQLDKIKERNSVGIGRNLSLIRDYIAREPRLSWVEPDNGVVCLPRIDSEVAGNELAGLLRRSFDTGVVPGRFFGRPAHFRIGFGVETSVLAEGLSRIEKTLALLEPS